MKKKEVFLFRVLNIFNRESHLQTLKTNPEITP